MKTRIRELRRLNGWTLKALADRLGTTPQTIQRLETGAISVSTEWLARFAEVFGTTPAALLGPVATAGHPAAEMLGDLGRSGRLRAGPSDARFHLDLPATRPVAVRVDEPTGPYGRGTILIANRLGPSDLAALGTCDALVALDPDTVLLRRLIRAADGSITLVPWSTADDVLHNVQPLWAARLVMRIEYL
jgi:transcriptional regulator with XRE-family HTH domain